MALAPPGPRRSPTANALGRALLILGDHRNLSIVREAFRSCRRFGDWQADVGAVGVPFVPPDDSGVFVFNCGAPAFQLSRERPEQEIGPRLVNMVRHIGNSRAPDAQSWISTFQAFSTQANPAILSVANSSA